MKKFIKVISVQLLILLFILPNLVYPQALTPAMIEYYFDLEDFGYGSEFEAADIMKLPGGGRFAQNYYYDIFPGNLIRIIFEDAQKTAVYDTAGKKFIDDGGWKSAEYNPMTSTDIRVQLDSGNWTILKDDYTLLNEKGWNQIGSGRTYKDSEFISVQINNGNWTYYDIAGGSLIDEEGWSANNSFYGDYACVKLDNGNWTSINKKGELFDETGWMRCGNFINGLMLISTGGKELDYPGSWNYDENTRWNFIKEDKTFLCDTDFKYADHFQDGDDSPDYTRVQLENGRWNLIKSDGTFISETGFNDIDGYSREYAKIKLDSGRWTFLRLRDGLLINETGWTETDNYLDDDDLALTWVKLESGKFNYIKSDGILLNETGWMKPGEYFGNECYKIYLDNGNVSLINKNGALLNETGWKDIVWANDGKSIIAKVQLDSGNWTYLNKDGALFNKTGWKDIEFFQFNDDGIYKIRLDSGKWTLMDNNGTLIDKTGWNDIDYSYPNKKNIVLVQPDSGNWTILKNDGTLLDEKGWDIPVECIVNGIYLKCLADKYEIKENNYNEWAFINRDSETVYKAGFWGESIFYNGYFNAGRHKDGVIRFCDMKGNKLIDREFKHLYAVDLYKIEREKTSEAFYYIDVNDNFGVIKYTQKSADLPAAADPTVAVADNPDAGHPDIPKTGVYFPAALYIFIVISSIFTIKKFYFSKKSLTPSATAAPSASR